MITLLTDFGTQDVYVGVMKGVIATLCPAIQVIDLTHDISPQDLLAARFNLLNAVPYFPADTVHVVVVDPGVGTTRKGIAVATDAGTLVGPDNGVMSGIWQQTAIQQAVELTNSAYWRTPDPSTTFHGRDIFAPVAAHLARGVPLTQLGKPIPADEVGESRRRVSVGQTSLPWHQAYGDVTVGQALALVGSHGWVEIAVNQGSVQKQLGVQVGDSVTLQT